MNPSKTFTPEEQKDLAQTPPLVVSKFEDVVGFKFELDVCANRATAKCLNYYSLDERGQDSLTLPWANKNWCNPPYSDITPWVNKCVYEAAQGNITALLIPNKPEVGYCRLTEQFADTVFKIPFRLNFIRPNGEPFLDKDGRKTSPKFPVYIALFTKWGLTGDTRYVEFDPRPY